MFLAIKIHLQELKLFLTKEEFAMTAVHSMNHTAFSCSGAAAGSSARDNHILDTANVLAVSICVLPVGRICRAGT